MYNLEGKVAVVTGVGNPRGMGRAITRRLAEEGASLVISDVCKSLEEQGAEHPLFSPIMGTRAGLDEAAAEVESMGKHALAMEVDVTKKEDVLAMVDAAMDKFGRIDILVNNAGTLIGVGPLSLINEGVWDNSFGVNVKGPFLCCQAVVPKMIEGGRGGKIVTISSMRGLRPGETGMDTGYSSSKAASIMMTKSLARELGPYNINVNVILPGLIESDMNDTANELYGGVRGMTAEEVKSQWIEAVPKKRCGTPEDIAKVAAFLVSDEADFISGEFICVAGGAT